MSPGSPPDQQPLTLDFLRGIPLFRTLDAKALQRLAACFEPVSLGARAMIYAAGDPGQALYVVLHGTVTLYGGVPDGETARALARLGRGDFFGELEVLAGGPRQDTARASDSSVVVLRIDRGELLGFLEDQPLVALKLEMAAARGHSVKAAAALASAPRHDDRIRVHRPVLIRTDDGTALPMKLVDVSNSGLRLDGVPDTWQAQAEIPFQLVWGPHSLDLLGRIAWRWRQSAGIELQAPTPDRHAHLQQALQQMLGAI